MSKLLSKMTIENSGRVSPFEALNAPEDVAYSRTLDYVVSTSASHPITPTTDVFNQTSGQTANTPSITDGGDMSEKDKLEHLQAQLHAAHSELSRMKEQELVQSRITKHTLKHVVGSGSDTDFQAAPLPAGYADRLGLPTDDEPLSRPALQRDNSWQLNGDAKSDTSDSALSAGGFNSARARAIWGNKPTFGSFPPASTFVQPPELQVNAPWANRPYGQPFMHAPMPVSAPANITTFRDAGYATERNPQASDFLMAPPLGRRGPGRFHNRGQKNHPYAGSVSSYDGYTPSPHGRDPSPHGIGPASGFVYPPVGFGNHINPGPGVGPFNHYPAPIGTPLSPHAPEFTSVAPGWKPEASYTLLIHSDAY